MIENFIVCRDDFLLFAIGFIWLLIANFAAFFYRNQRINLWFLGKTDLNIFTQEEKQSYIPWNYMIISAIAAVIAKWTACFDGIYNNLILVIAIGVFCFVSLMALFMGVVNASIIRNGKACGINVFVFAFILVIPYFSEEFYFAAPVWELIVSLPALFVIIRMLRENARKNDDATLKHFAVSILASYIFEIITCILFIVYNQYYVDYPNNHLLLGRVIASILMLVSIALSAYFLWIYGRKLTSKKGLLFRGFWVPIVVILFLSLCLSFRESRFTYQSNVIVQRMTSFAIKVARVIVMEDLKPFDTSAEQNAKFDSINKLLFAYKRYAGDYAGITSIWKNGKGGYVFGPESYQPGEVLSSPRWSEYKNVPEAIERCFKEKRFIVGSYEDEYAHFLSVMVPLVSRDTNDVYSVLMLDFLYDEYIARFVPEILGVILVAIFMACFLQACIIIFDSRRNFSRKRTFVLLPAAVIFIFCFGITSILTYYVSIVTYDDAFDYFDDAAKAKSGQIIGAFDRLSTELSGIEYYGNNININSRKDFEEILANIQNYGEHISFEYRSRIKGSDIKAFEEEQRNKDSFNENYEVRIFDKIGGKRLGIDEDMYYWPSVYGHYNNIVNSHIGEDYIEYTRRKALRYIQATNKPMALCPSDIQNKFKNSQAQGILVYMPFEYVGSDRFKSVFVAIIELQSTIEHMMPEEYYKADNVGFEIFEPDEVEGLERQLCLFPKGEKVNKDFQTVVPLFFKNKTFGLRVFGLDGRYRSNIFNNTPTLAVVIVGFILSLVIASFVYFMKKREADLENQVEKAAENAKNHEQLASEMTDVLPLVAYQTFCDENWTPVFVSKYLEELVGHSINDYIGRKRSFKDYIYPEDLNRVVSAIKNGIDNYGSFAVQYRIIDKNNNVLWVDNRGFAGGRDLNGKPAYVNGFLYDITERKKIFARMKQVLTNLNDANQELNEVTEKSNKIAIEAEKANRVKENLLAELSRALRTPMSSIVGACGLLKDSKLSEEQKGMADNISEDSDKLLAILNDVLGESNLKLAAIDLKKDTVSENKPISENEKNFNEHKRLLVVEDNKTNQKVVLAILKKLGFTAEIANDGAEALKLLSNKYFDLIFMDCQMPIIDGFEATRRIRKGEGVVDPNVTIVALTANAMAADKAKCFEVGMNDFLSKPVTPKDLAGILDKWL